MSTQRLPIGLLQVYTGDGKGKTTAAVGLALRALGAGLTVAFLQLFKGPVPSAEWALLGALGPRLWVKRFLHELTSFSLGQGEPADEDRAAAEAAWRVARETLLSGAWDVVVLDEVNNLLAAGLLPLDDFLAVLQARPSHVEVVCTGRGAPPELLQAADLVTEMHEVKHPFESGVQARKGIEF